MKLKKLLLMGLSLVTVAAISVGGTLAFLQDTDSDVNVMTLGKVEIVQHEQQLADDGVTLEPFEQAKDIYPGTDVSKIVTVENTGESDIYFRTLIAFEDLPNSETFGMDFPIGEFSGYTWSWGAPAATIVIDGVTYQVYEARYNTVLKPGETSPASLTKVVFNTTCTNEDMEALGDTYEILVLSQAVQAEGFENAKTALDTAFGKSSEKAAEWFGGITIASEVGITEGGVYDLEGDVYTIDSAYFHTQKVTGETVTINGNGATVEGIATSEDAFQWEGNIPDMSAIFSSADGSKVTVNDLKFTGTMSSIMLGNYVNATYNKFDTELNNVDVIGTEVVSFSSNIAPAVTVYGSAVLNNCNIYGTTRSALETAPLWPVYDLALTNYTTTTLNNSTVGSIYMWNQANLTIDGNSEVDSIVVLNKVSSKFAITVKGDSTVKEIDLSMINASYEDKVTITIEDGATVGAFVDNGVYYDTLDAWKAANN